MKYESEIIGEVVVIKLKDPSYTSTNAGKLKSLLVDMVNKGTVRAVLDMSGVDMVDSSGLGIIISINITLQNNGGWLAVCGLTDDIKKLFSMTKMEKLMRVCDSVDQALKI